MFNSGKRTSTPINGEKIDTLVGKNTSLEGTVNAEGTIRIDGRINGGLNISGNVIVGEESIIKGNIKADNAFVAGTVEGNVTATSQLHITHTAKLYGDITVRNIVIDEGAVFVGNCKIITEDNIN